MYVWFVSLSSGSTVDQGIWQSKNGGASWTQISDSGIISCGDANGCGVQQAFYDLELLAQSDDIKKLIDHSASSESSDQLQIHVHPNGQCHSGLVPEPARN